MPDQLNALARRLRASWRLSRQTEPFHLEQDEIANDLESLAGLVARETVFTGNRATVNERGV